MAVALPPAASAAPGNKTAGGGGGSMSLGHLLHTPGVGECATPLSGGGAASPAYFDACSEAPLGGMAERSPSLTPRQKAAAAAVQRRLGEGAPSSAAGTGRKRAGSAGPALTLADVTNSSSSSRV